MLVLLTPPTILKFTLQTVGTQYWLGRYKNVQILRKWRYPTKKYLTTKKEEEQEQHMKPLPNANVAKNEI